MTKLHAPFPWFGGKRRWADIVIENFGETDVYVEPFSGSLAVLLQKEPSKREVVCDVDGGICNFWRAIQYAPDEVAKWCDWPTIHDDLTARHAWLIQWFRNNRVRLTEEPEYFDAKVAGWWAWGISLWIGHSWCDSKNDSPGSQIPEIKNTTSGKGVSKQRVNKPELGLWFDELRKRLENVIVLNRGWESAVTEIVLGYANNQPLSAAVFLDPPYLHMDNNADSYSSDVIQDGINIAAKVYEWAVNCRRPNTRIAYCCNEGDFPVPDGWTYVVKSFKGSRTRSKSKSDMIMFSPGCVGTGLSSDSAPAVIKQSTVSPRASIRGLRSRMPRREGGV